MRGLRFVPIEVGIEIAGFSYKATGKELVLHGIKELKYDFAIRGLSVYSKILLTFLHQLHFLMHD